MIQRLSLSWNGKASGVDSGTSGHSSNGGEDSRDVMAKDEGLDSLDDMVIWECSDMVIDEVWGIWEASRCVITLSTSPGPFGSSDSLMAVSIKAD